MSKSTQIGMFELFINPTEKKFNHSQFDSHALEKCYQELIVKHHVQSDAGQIKVLGHLQALLNQLLVHLDSETQSIISRFISFTPATLKGLYIYGDVGRGKSMLMDVFFEASPIKSKRRIHFHAFMQEMHEFLYLWRQQKKPADPIPKLVEKLRKSAVLLCFDEFQVTDIADAMLLSRLFTGLFKAGVIVVATSNQHPDDLYKNGLQRELFLPFIDLLKESTTILELVAKEDYRLSHFKSMQTIFYSEAEGGAAFLKSRFKELTNDGRLEEMNLHVKGRKLHFSLVHGDILFTSFNELCNRPLGPADYLAVANEFNTILLSGIPRLSIENRDLSRRFVTLIDALYEHNVKLICTSAVPLKDLMVEDVQFDFKRTQSRLVEMQSEQYLQREHLA